MEKDSFDNVIDKDIADNFIKLYETTGDISCLLKSMNILADVALKKVEMINEELEDIRCELKDIKDSQTSMKERLQE